MNNNRVYYWGKDFDTILAELQQRVKDYYQDKFDDFRESDLGVVILDLVAHAIENLIFYADRYASELFPYTAVLDSSVRRLARLVGYRAHGAARSTAVVTITLEQSYSDSILIPAGFRFSGPHGLIFETLTENYILPNTTQMDVEVGEGFTVKEFYVSSGAANQVFRLSKVESGKFVADKTVKVKVNGEEWQEVNFIEYGVNKQYEVWYGRDDVYVRFGNGAAGQIPPAGASIEISYVQCSGSAGRVLAHSITSAIDTLYLHGETVKIQSVDNAQPSSMGADPEPIESVRAAIPNWFKARNVAITKDDIETLAKNFVDPNYGAVAAAKAITSRSGDSDVTFALLINDLSVFINQLRLFFDLTMKSGASYHTALESMDTQADEAKDYLVSGSLNIHNEANFLYDGSGPSGLLYEIEVNSRQAKGHSSYSAELKDNINDLAGKIVEEAQKDNPDTDKIQAWAENIQAYCDVLNDELSGLASNLNNITNNITTAEDRISAIYSYATIAAARIDMIIDKIAELRYGSSDIPLGFTPSYQAFVESDEPYSIPTALAKLGQLQQYYNSIVASDSRVNAVSVPILARDEKGFYTAPSEQLISALQDYLNKRCNATTDIVVIDGSYMLVKVNLQCDLFVPIGINMAEVKQDFLERLDNLFLQMDFGRALRLSDLYEVLNNTPNVLYGVIVVTSTDPSGKKADSGDVEVNEQEVIVKGEIVVNVHTVANVAAVQS